jgi:hypothetical protein
MTPSCSPTATPVLSRRMTSSPLWHSLHMDEKMIMTGASIDAARMSMNALGIGSVYASHGMALSEKIHALRVLHDFHKEKGGVTYVDADAEVCKYVSERAGCTGLTFV